MYACAWDFLIMKTRILIHYFNGKTFIGDWDISYNLNDLNMSPISSLQIQEESGKYHTLSLKRKQLNAFWQRDLIKEDKILNRSILRKLAKDVWVDLNLDCISGKRRVTIIKENIKVK